MHCKYLGLDQYQFGSILYLLCHFVLGDTPESNLKLCWNFIQLYYKRHKVEVRYRYLNKLTMFTRKNKTPKLKGKAAEIKYFGQVLLALWTRFMKSTIAIHKQIQLMLKMNVRMEALIIEHKHSVKFPAAAAMEFKECAFAMSMLQQSCAEHFSDNEDCPPLFATTSKNHMVQHIAILAEFINPRLLWCFTGEDMMRKTQKLIGSCCKGLKAPDASVKAVRHYRLGLHILLSEMD